MEKLRLVEPSLKYEEKAISYIREFIEYQSNINGTGGLQRYLEDYEGWLKKLEEDKRTIPNEERVPAETYFLVREDDDKIIGMINIRLVLNKRLRNIGGHIGYSIRPTERRKGYNKINLYLGLEKCKEHGIKEVLMDCEKENIGSAKTMQALGGKLIKEEYKKSDICDGIVQDYTINVDDAISKNKEKYKDKISSFK